jgi:hypothetical protein
MESLMMMFRRVCALVAVAALVPIVIAAQKPIPRAIFVSTVDQAGGPALDLKAEDFEIVEGGVKKPVSRAAIAASPMRVALLVDTSQAAEKMIDTLRKSLPTFVDAVAAEDELALVTIGGRSRTRGKPPVDRAKVRTDVTKLSSDSGPVVLLDGLKDAYNQFMRQPEVKWPVFVVVTTESADGSTGVRGDDYGKLVNEMLMKGTTVHVIGIQSAAPGSVAEYAKNLTQNLGGLYESTAPTALDAALAKMSARLADDHSRMSRTYQVEFMGDPTPKEIQVRVVKPDIGITKVSATR